MTISPKKGEFKTIPPFLKKTIKDIYAYSVLQIFSYYELLRLKMFGQIAIIKFASQMTCMIPL